MKYWFLIVLLAGILVAIWFRDGNILGTAESKIPFYNLESFRKITEYAWVDYTLGFNSNLTIASAPSWWLLSEIQGLGVPGYALQAITFWLLFVSAGVGIYGLTKILFPDLRQKYLFLAILFYWFNSLSMVNVWNRFLYNYMVFWALLPLLLFLFIVGLQKRRYIFAIIFGLISAIFSYAFTAYVFNLLIWSLLIFTWLFFILAFRKKEFTLFAIKFLLLSLVFFGLVNAWWIIPTFQFIQSKNTAKELSFFVSTEGNIYTLNILSRKVGNLVDILRFMHRGFYQGEGPGWSNIYNGFFPNLIFFALSGAIFWVIYQLRSKLSILYLAIILFLGLYIAKGSNQPFSEIFKFFFANLPFLQILRDPFEKIGFIIALVSAPLFAVAISQFEKYGKKVALPIFILSLFLILGFLGFPFFSGLVFTSITPPNDNYKVGFQVKVPPYYKEADKWLKEQGKNFRFISFPLGDEGMTYKWERGYQGVEPSEILFSTPNISFNTTIPYYSQIAEKLEELLFKKEDFSRIANLLNVRYLLVRSDVDIRERRLRDPRAIENLLKKMEEQGSFEKVAQFERLGLWENTSWIDRTIYAANKPIFTLPQSKISDILLGDEDRDILLTADVQKEINSMEGLNILYPEEEKIETPPNEIPAFERNKEYKINIEKQSDYELILDNIILSESEASLAANIKVLVDKNPISQKNQLKNNKISYGVLNLNPGLHKISIERPVTGNLISAPEETIISTIKNSKQVSFEIRDFNPYVKYLVGLDYLISSGENFAVLFNQSNDLIRNNKIVYQVPYFNVLTRGQRSNAFIHANGGYIPQRSDSAALLFWADPAGHFEVTLKNISVNHLIEPQPLLIQNNPVINSPLPQITYVKHNPTRYSVRVKDSNSSFILILSELFNSNWEAILDDGTKVKKHFLANAYANGWLIEKSGDFNLTLEFAPQRLLDLGKIISFLSFVGGLVYIIVRKFLWRLSIG